MPKPTIKIIEGKRCVRLELKKGDALYPTDYGEHPAGNYYLLFGVKPGEECAWWKTTVYRPLKPAKKGKVWGSFTHPKPRQTVAWAVVSGRLIIPGQIFPSAKQAKNELDKYGTKVIRVRIIEDTKGSK